MALEGLGLREGHQRGDWKVGRLGQPNLWPGLQIAFHPPRPCKGAARSSGLEAWGSILAREHVDDLGLTPQHRFHRGRVWKLSESSQTPPC